MADTAVSLTVRLASTSFSDKPKKSFPVKRVKTVKVRLLIKVCVIATAAGSRWTVVERNIGVLNG